MKNFILVSIIILTALFSVKAQVKMNLDFGIGIAKNQIKGNYNYGGVKNPVGPVIGFYPTILINNHFRLETGVELISTSSSTENGSYNENNNFSYSYKTTNSYSRMNTPLIFGYDININKIKLSPYVGASLNYGFNATQYYESSEQLGELSKRERSESQFLIYHNSKNKVMTQRNIGLKVIYNSRLQLDMSYSFGSEYYRAIEYSNLSNAFIIDCYCGPNEIYSNNEYKLVFRYTLY